MAGKLFDCWATKFIEQMCNQGLNILLLLKNVSTYHLTEPLSNV